MKNKPKITYIATKPIPNKKGLIAPWFDESGMGIQHFTDMEVGYLMNNGYLKIIEWGKNNAVKARINGIAIKNRGDKS